MSLKQKFFLPLVYRGLEWLHTVYLLHNAALLLTLDLFNLFVCAYARVLERWHSTDICPRLNSPLNSSHFSSDFSVFPRLKADHRTYVRPNLFSQGSVHTAGIKEAWNALSVFACVNPSFSWCWTHLGSLSTPSVSEKCFIENSCPWPSAVCTCTSSLKTTHWIYSIQ